jgi:hypothetical protein
MVRFVVHLLRRNNGFHHVDFCIWLRHAQTQHERTLRNLPRLRRRCKGTWRCREKNRLDTEIRQLAKSINVVLEIWRQYARPVSDDAAAERRCGDDEEGKPAVSRGSHERGCRGRYAVMESALNARGERGALHRVIITAPRIVLVTL